ncbi:MAG TPA: hypothetical protein VHU90_05695 [Galbitalea sp.]|nr:hypothetical protein [Galbitalea sp.]
MATAVVAAVIIIQGTGSSVPTISPASGVTFTASSSVSAPSNDDKSAIAAVDTGGQTSTSSGSSQPSSSSPSVPSAAAPGGGTYTASAASADVGTRTYTTTPATVVEPAPTPPPAAPVCPSAIGGSTAGAPGASDPSGIPGTTSADLNSFAAEYNALRVANCLTPIPFANIRYSSCLQARMWWMADDPSTDPASAWGHTGTAVRSDGVPIVGCDGDLAGGNGYTAASVADAWWASPDHRASLFQPAFTGNVAGVCIAFAMSHGGVNVPAPNEPYSFTRAAAYWYSC